MNICEAERPSHRKIGESADEPAVCLNGRTFVRTDSELRCVLADAAPADILLDEAREQWCDYCRYGRENRGVKNHRHPEKSVAEFKNQLYAMYSTHIEQIDGTALAVELCL